MENLVRKEFNKGKRITKSQQRLRVEIGHRGHQFWKYFGKRTKEGKNQNWNLNCHGQIKQEDAFKSERKGS